MTASVVSSKRGRVPVIALSPVLCRRNMRDDSKNPAVRISILRSGEWRSEEEGGTADSLCLQ